MVGAKEEDKGKTMGKTRKKIKTKYSICDPLVVTDPITRASRMKGT